MYIPTCTCTHNLSTKVGPGSKDKPPWKQIKKALILLVAVTIYNRHFRKKYMHIKYLHFFLYIVALIPVSKK